MKSPCFFIVGAPRCGTSAMCTYLRQHQDIFMAKKESHFFATDLNSPRFINKLTQYLSLFSEAKTEKRIGEASVMYLYSKEAPGNIKRFSPQGRIIIMLRNPVDMLYSLYTHNVHEGSEDIGNFNAALQAEEDRKKGLRIPPTTHLVEGLYYHDIVRTSEKVKRYFNVFGRENVKVLIYEQFRNCTAEVYRETLTFLGVSPKILPEFPVIGANKNVRSIRIQRLIKNKRISKLIGSFLPVTVESSIKRSLIRLNTQYSERPALSLVLSNQLKKEFTPEVYSLSELLGQDLTFWIEE